MDKDERKRRKAIKAMAKKTWWQADWAIAEYVRICSVLYQERTHGIPMFFYGEDYDWTAGGSTKKKDKAAMKYYRYAWQVLGELAAATEAATEGMALNGEIEDFYEALAECASLGMLWD